MALSNDTVEFLEHLTSQFSGVEALALQLGYTVRAFVVGEITDQERDKLIDSIMAEWDRLESVNPHNCVPDSLDGFPVCNLRKPDPRALCETRELCAEALQ